MILSLGETLLSSYVTRQSFEEAHLRQIGDEPSRSFALETIGMLRLKALLGKREGIPCQIVNFINKQRELVSPCNSTTRSSFAF